MEGNLAGLSLAEVAARFLAELDGEARQKFQQDINRFVRWSGGSRPMVGLTASEVDAYASSMVAMPDKLKPIREFLRYARKQGFIRVSLAPHLRLKKTAPRTVTRSALRKAVALTPEGYAKLEAELVKLKADRLRVAEELRLAMADKDFAENAPLDAARNRQGHLEAQIREIESSLRSASLVQDEARPQHKIGLGSRLKLLDLATGETLEYMLVPPREASLARGRLSIASPTGHALLERHQNDTIEVTAPAGTLRYLIQEVSN